jgi:hypothetical protein
MEGTIGELLSLVPLVGLASSQFPPLTVLVRTVNGTVRRRVQNVEKLRQRLTAALHRENVRPVCGIRMVCGTAEGMVTAKVTVCTGTVLVLLNVKNRCTRRRRVTGSAVTLMVVDPNAASDPLVADAATMRHPTRLRSPG